MSFFGVQLNAQLNRLFLEIRIKLSQNKFVPNFRTIYRSFVSFDPQVTGLISLTDFEKVLNQNKIFMKVWEIQVFEKAYKHQSGNINWFSFMAHLRQPMGPLRRQLVQRIFDSIDTEKQKKVTPEQLMVHFNANQIDHYKKYFKSEQQLQNTLLGLLSTPDGFITREQFVAFYDDCNINFHHNQVFFRYVSSQWHYTPEKLQIAKEEQVKALSKLFRSKLIQKSQATKDDYLVRKLFQQFDLNQNYSIGPYQFDLMLKKVGSPGAPKLVEPLLEKIDQNKSGFIQYDQFKKYLFTDPYPL